MTMNHSFWVPLACLAACAPGASPADPCAMTVPSTAGWTAYDEGAFTLQLPPGYSRAEAQGIDSQVGRWEAPGKRVSYDFGVYSNRLQRDDLNAFPGLVVCAEGEGPEEPRIILHEPADGGYAVSAHWAGVREQGPGRTASLTLEGVVQSAEDRGELLEIIRSVRIDRSAAGAAPTGGDSTGATDATGAVSDPTSLLTGDEWSVTRLESSETTRPQRPTLLFGADGALTGHGGCNRFRGTFEVTGESVAIGPVMATRMACAEEAANAQETRFFALLEQVTGYRIDGAGGLELLAGERPVIVAQR